MAPGRLVVVTAMLALSAGAACSPERPLTAEPVPPWLAALIGQYAKAPAANPPLIVARYTYGGQVVYYVPPRCCDIWSDLYDARGAVLCHPDGGFSGQGDGHCADFFAKRADERIIWRDPRGSS